MLFPAELFDNSHCWEKTTSCAIDCSLPGDRLFDRFVRISVSASTNKPDLFIYGAGGHGRVIGDSATRAGFRHLIFVDDAVRSQELQGHPVVAAKSRPPAAWAGCCYIVAIGSNLIRSRVFTELLAMGAIPTSVIDPNAVIAPSAKIGSGSFLAAGVVVNNGARIGDNCIINTNASVDHDCVLGAHAQVSPAACLTGNVSLGVGAMIGAGAIIVPGRKVGDLSVVGAGAVVTRDLPENVVAWGAPARIINKVE